MSSVRDDAPATDAVELTDEQEVVVTADPESRILVLAGPGTGKTEVLARRLVHLLDSGLRPSQLLVLSFSRNAVRNVSDRVRRLSDIDESTMLELRHLVVRTFDSWSFRTLRRSGESAEDLLQGSYTDNIAKLVGILQSGQKDEVKTKLSHIKHVVVDELQDLAGWRGELVIELLKMLAPSDEEGVGFTLLGDPAQAIYGFSLRSDSENSSSFSAQDLLAAVRNSYSDSLVERCLVGNFRSQQEIAKIVEEAREILLGDESAEQKLEKLSEIVNRSPVLDLDEAQQDPDGPPRKLAVLCETNGQALAVANTLYGRSEEPPKLPIEIAAGSPTKTVPVWIGATLGQFQADQLTKSNFSRIYEHLYGTDSGSTGRLGIPEMDIAWELLTTAVPSPQGQESISIGALRDRLSYRDLLPDDVGVLESSIEITTVHQSKGLEYDQVRLVRDEKNNNQAQDAGESDDGGLLEEANVLFVALSRAGESFGQIEDIGPSSLRKLSFNNESRTRWGARWGWTNRGQVEIGLSGDIEATSFVSKEYFPTAENVQESQEWIARNADSILGRKVILIKKALPDTENHFIYHVHLQEDGDPGQFICTCRPQLTFDLLSFKKAVGLKSFPLPNKIYNLRITDVVTLSGTGDRLIDVHEPWSKSGLWIGIKIHGLGFFMYLNRNTKKKAKKKTKR